MAQYNVHIYYETKAAGVGIHWGHARDWEYDHYPTPEEIYEEIELDLKNIGVPVQSLMPETVSTTVVEEPAENQ